MRRRPGRTAILLAIPVAFAVLAALAGWSVVVPSTDLPDRVDVVLVLAVARASVNEQASAWREEVGAGPDLLGWW